MDRVTQVTKTPMTLEEYLATPETVLPMELINGELIRYPIPRDAHQATVGAIVFYLMSNFSNGRTVLSPMDVYLGTDILQPDVFWITPESPCQVGQDGWFHGPPDLVIEVLESPRITFDRGVKFRLYQQHGVREYWLVDTLEQYVEVFVLHEGVFIQQGLYGAGENFTSQVLSGQNIEVKALFES